MRGKIISPLSDQEVVNRARHQCGRPILYQLKFPNGGMDPEAAGPEDPDKKVADCIALACWAAGLDRHNEHFPATPSVSGASINTDSMIEEAKLHGKWFTITKEPALGDFIVTHTFWRKLPIPKRVIGHIGVMVDVELYPTKGLGGLRVVHCSPGNYQYTGKKSAIWTTSGSVWARYPEVCFVHFNRDYAKGL